MNNFSLSTLSLLAVVVVFLFINCQADLCPDHKKSCRKGQTCCDDKQGGYGCCPYENATCCSDGLHCCPQGTECELSAGRCRRRSSEPIRQSLLIPVYVLDNDDSSPTLLGNDLEIDADATMFNATVSNDKKKCPDKESSCPSTYTCCADPEGSFACCPFPNATCCSDKIHCCPHGRKCTNSRCE